MLSGAEASQSNVLRLLPGCRYAHLATHGFFADEQFRSKAGHELAGEQLFGGSATLSSGWRGGVTYRNPLLLSGIVLAGANLPQKNDAAVFRRDDDGILTAEQIVSADLRNVELVVLSACSSGVGRMADEEGIMGLTRAFHLAGAKSVVASLWQVDDRATRALMVEFYKNLWEKKLSKLEALRQAQLTMLRQYDPKEGKLRGAGVLKPVDPAKLARAFEAGAKAREPLAPFYWAAFVLSGDGR